jgi:hypothetical protein
MSDINVVPPDLQSRIKYWRSRSNSGEITLDEMKQAVIDLRQGRRTAAVAAEESGKKSRSKKPAKSADELLKELGSLGI